MQSFLWAIKNRDAENFLRLLTPEFREMLLKHVGSPEGIFESKRFFVPGFRVVGQRSLPDGAVELQIEFVPGMGSAGADGIRFRQIAGEWKLDMR